MVAAEAVVLVVLVVLVEKVVLEDKVVLLVIQHTLDLLVLEVPWDGLLCTNVVSLMVAYMDQVVVPLLAEHMWDIIPIVYQVLGIVVQKIQTIVEENIVLAVLTVDIQLLNQVDKVVMEVMVAPVVKADQAV